MELRHLRYFMALAEHSHFTRAASQLNITQSTLSHTIKQLDEELGIALFDRVGKKITLNQEGHLFLATAARTLQELDSGIIGLKHSATALSGEVRVGATHTFNIRLIPNCIAAFLAKHPTVRLHVEELPASSVCDGLLKEDLDVGISYPPFDEETYASELLFSEELVLLVPVSHPFASRRHVRMVELHKQPLILPTRGFGTRNLLDACFASVRAEPVVVAELNTIAPLIEACRLVKVPAIVSEFAVSSHPDLKVVRLDDPKPIRTPVLLWKKDRVQTVTARAFANIVKQAAREAALHRSRQGQV